MNTIDAPMTFRDIESPDFASRVSAASDWRTMIAAVDLQREVVSLQASLVDELSVDDLGARFYSLIEPENADKFRSRFDVPCFVYLLMIHRIDPTRAVQLSAEITDRYRYYWTGKLSSALESLGQPLPITAPPITKERNIYFQHGIALDISMFAALTSSYNGGFRVAAEPMFSEGNEAVGEVPSSNETAQFGNVLEANFAEAA